MARFFPGDMVGPYKLIEHLGEGSFGEVWKAIELETFSREVALKIPKGSSVNRDEFEREAKTWVLASGHPFVLPIHRALAYADPRATTTPTDREKTFVIVSEYAQDGSLEDYLNCNGGKVPTIEEGVALMQKILTGLAYLHTPDKTGRRNKPCIIHRDLKPANIMMQEGIPRISDFGQSRVIQGSNKISTTAGSPAYMAPEVFRGVRNELTDIWAAGVLFYQLITGSLPFDVADFYGLSQAILHALPSSMPESIPLSLQSIIFKCLEKNPQNRYQSAADILQDLSHWQQATLPGIKRVIKNSLGMEFVYIPPGDFMMSSDDIRRIAVIDPSMGDAKDVRVSPWGGKMELPHHKVTISQPFYLGRFRVTEEQWKEVLKWDFFQGFMWDEVERFILELNDLNDGYFYRLPT